MKKLLKINILHYINQEYVCIKRIFFFRCQLVTSEETNSSLWTGNMFFERCPENILHKILKIISICEKKILQVLENLLIVH